jgi:hypothetical protein
VDGCRWWNLDLIVMIQIRDKATTEAALARLMPVVGTGKRRCS